MGKNLKYNCVFGGGGIRGLAYIGAMEALDELNIELHSLAGSSVGAVFAALYAVGYSKEEIKEFFFDFNLNMFRDININFFDNDISFSKGEIFYNWLRDKISEKIDINSKQKNSPITFADIEADLKILTLDLNTNSPFIFSKENTPDAEIAFAVRASAGMPGLMKPIQYQNMLLVDGDMIKSWPASKIFPEFISDDIRLLEFRLEGSRDGSNIKNPADYINSIISIVWYLTTENVYEEYSNND
ncbi:patatin-like phospholipase family protein, partial [bacterium]|nr:patatin-like phospholipase family protein [bacterium]